jgi:phospholipid transport system substrate-binding protein
LCLTPTSLFAQSQPAATHDPIQPIADLNSGLLRVMHAGKSTPFDQRVTILTPTVLHAFDLAAILQNSVGPARWSTLPDAEKTELMDVFTRFTVDSYVANFNAYAGEKFVIAPEMRHVGNEVVVQTKIVATSGDPIKMDYVMRESDSGWRAVDILLDGSISRVAVTRSDFRALLAQGGASHLIESLRSKAVGLESGIAP